MDKEHIDSASQPKEMSRAERNKARLEGFLGASPVKKLVIKMIPEIPGWGGPRVSEEARKGEFHVLSI